jgi:hypothetical protein
LRLDDDLLALRGQVTAVDTSLSCARRSSVASAFSPLASPEAIAVSRSSSPRSSWSWLKRSDFRTVIAAELTQKVEQALVVTGDPGLLATLASNIALSCSTSSGRSYLFDGALPPAPGHGNHVCSSQAEVLDRFGTE